METCHEMNCLLSGGAQEVTNVKTLTASVRQDTERRLNSGIVVYRSRISSGHFGQVLTESDKFGTLRTSVNAISARI
jgi:hypothetical protein